MRGKRSEGVNEQLIHTVTCKYIYSFVHSCFTLFTPEITPRITPFTPSQVRALIAER